MKMLRLLPVLVIIILSGGFCRRVSAATPANIAVILVKFTNSTNPTFTRSDAHRIMFTDSKSVKNYYEEVSNGNLTINGQTYDWVTIPFTKPTQTHPAAPGDIQSYFNSADSLVAQAGNNLGEFNYKFYVFTDPLWGFHNPDGGAINNAGFTAYNSLYTYIHELGHVFGLAHANFLDCHTKSIDAYQNCTEIEYGDAYDVMGDKVSHLNAPHKIVLGWMPYSRMLAVTGDGDYQIDAIELNSDHYQALRIPKPDTREYYIVEYRQPIGFDADQDQRLSGGVSIRIWNNSPGRPTRLINPVIVSGVSSNYRPLLYDNEEFYDQINHITIKQISHNADSASLNIKVSAAAMTGYRIEGRLLDQYGEPAAPANRSVTVKRLDGSGFTRTSSLTSDWTFDDLETGYYEVTAAAAPGDRIVSSACSNCNFHNTYSGRETRYVTFSPTDNFTNISYKYLANSGDIDNNRIVDYGDLTSLVTAFSNYSLEADLNDDKSVNIFDFAHILKNYGTQFP